MERYVRLVYLGSSVEVWEDGSTASRLSLFLFGNSAFFTEVIDSTLDPIV